MMSAKLGKVKMLRDEERGLESQIMRILTMKCENIEVYHRLFVNIAFLYEVYFSSKFFTVRAYMKS
jgi:hypothetical protein